MVALVRHSAGYTEICSVCVLRVFENRVLRGVFGPKRDGVTG
jgi:hypothetical protein